MAPPGLFRVADIQPNPWRNLGRYPVNRDKVDALRESLRTTGFWDNVVARLNSEGLPEIAYGHHRLVALHEEFGPDQEVALIIRDLDDAEMIRIMARENMEEFGTSATAQIETVRSVVEAFATGKIALRKPFTFKDEDAATPFIACAAAYVERSPKFIEQVRKGYLSIIRNHIEPVFGQHTLGDIADDNALIRTCLDRVSNTTLIVRNVKAIINGTFEEFAVDGPDYRVFFKGRVRIAPDFTEQRVVEGMNFDKAYTYQDIGRFTGWQQVSGAPQERVKNALLVLETIQIGLATDTDFDDLSLRAAAKVAAKMRSALADRKALAKLAPSDDAGKQILAQGHTDVANLGKYLIDEIASGRRGSGQIDQSARDSGFLIPAGAVPLPPDIERYSAQLARRLNTIMLPTEIRVRELEKVIEYRTHLSVHAREEIVKVLQEIALRSLSYAEQLQGSQADAIDGVDSLILEATRKSITDGREVNNENGQPQ